MAKFSAATFAEEEKLWQSGYASIIGLDEVGRGAWAGPLVVGGVLFPKNCSLGFTLADSKLLTPKRREELVPEIKAHATAWTTVEVPTSVIDKVGIGNANQIAFRKVLMQLKHAYDFILIDAFYVAHIQKGMQKPIVHGDAISATIAAASILAKVHRDGLMTGLHTLFPAYRFDIHKGYGTKLHRDAIGKHGLCQQHRSSYNLAKYL